MARKTKDQAAAPQAEERDHDPSGHYDFCIAVISPPGHRPLASCHLRVWWVSRRQFSWSTKKATADDHSVEHVCRGWTSEEDARIRAMEEETAASRYAVQGVVAQATPRARLDRAPAGGPSGPPAEEIPDDGFLPIATVRPKRALTEKAVTNITLNGKPADANVRAARKVHSCSGCDATVGHGVSYLESRVGAKSAFEPFRYCGKCWPTLGYAIAAD